MKQDLKRCPWCNTHELTSDWMNEVCQIRCLNCGAMEPTSTSEVLAVTRWNGEHRHQNDSAILCGNMKKNNRADKKAIDL